MIEDAGQGGKDAVIPAVLDSWRVWQTLAVQDIELQLCKGICYVESWGFNFFF